VAAALREVLTYDPIVVGGTAEEYWTAADYHETDLDLCAPLTESDRRSLTSLGFRKQGRHWYHARAHVAVEFPDSRIDGDESRTHEEPVGEGMARIIGLDDLYMDRLKQATMSEERGGIEFQSALAVTTSTFDAIDWAYVGARIRGLVEADTSLGESMKRLDARIRRRVRRLLSES